MHNDIMETLHTAERTRVAVPPLTETRPELTQADAYAVQEAWLQRKLADGGRLAGRKVGITSRAMQQQLGVDEPDFGFLLEAMLAPSGSTLPRAELLQPRVFAARGPPLRGPLRSAGSLAALVRSPIPFARRRSDRRGRRGARAGSWPRRRPR